MQTCPPLSRDVRNDRKHKFWTRHSRKWTEYVSGAVAGVHRNHIAHNFYSTKTKCTPREGKPMPFKRITESHTKFNPSRGRWTQFWHWRYNVYHNRNSTMKSNTVTSYLVQYGSEQSHIMRTSTFALEDMISQDNSRIETTSLSCGWTGIIGPPHYSATHRSQHRSCSIIPWNRPTALSEWKSEMLCPVWRQRTSKISLNVFLRTPSTEC